ncbi:MAG: hypothetical protein ABJA98_33655 [Acidobacteriota bacterium]
MSPLATYIPLSDIVTWWPDHLFGNPGLEALAITSYKLVQSSGQATGYLDLSAANDIVITMADVEGFAVVVPASTLHLEADYTGSFELRVGGFGAALRITSSVIVPVDGVYPAWSARLDADGKPEPIELALDVGQLIVDADFNPYIDVTNALTIAPFMLGNTGIVVGVTGAQLFLSGKETPPPGQPSGFRGVSLDQVSIYLPTSFELPGVLPNEIRATGLVIGHGGVSGALSGEWQTGWDGLTPSGSGSGRLLGMPFALKSLGVALTQNALTSVGFVGELGVPFLDSVLAVEVSLDMDGTLAVALSSTGEQGIVTIESPIGSFRLSALGFVSDGAGSAVVVSGAVQLTVGAPALQWPEIAFQDLRIGSGGDVSLPGGWLDLQEPLALDLYGFRMEISGLGFGREDDGRRWVGFSGGVHLVDMLPTGVSVEGLRVLWDPAGKLPPQVSLDGVGIQLTIPGALTLDGDVALKEEVVTVDGQDSVQRFFLGNAKLEIVPIGVTLDASVKIGRDTTNDFNFAYTYLSLELPIGIPIWATGAAIYGVSGLYGMNVKPSASGDDWYAWYIGPPEKFSVTNAGKWIGAEDGRAFGAGMVLGTLFDAGRVVSTKALLALILPGPVIVFDGKANVLSASPKLGDANEAVFDLLGVFDGNAADLQLNIDAGWTLPQVVDISASAEAYFDFANPTKWHLYLGQDTPEDRRIRAYVIALFHADAYLMIDSRGISTGCGVNFGQDWKFGPVRAALQSWVEAEAAISWQPPQLEGSFGLGGEFEISVAGFGVGIGAEATLSGKAPTLYWVRGELALQVKLPFPLKDLEEDIALEWRQEATPASEDAFKAIGLDHPKVDETWPDLHDIWQDVAPGALDTSRVPIVPLDARPSIVFDRAVRDALSGADLVGSAYGGPTRIGEHQFDYELTELTLEKWSKAGDTKWQSVPDLYGSWMAVEDGSATPPTTQLQLWTKSPFEFTRRSSRTYRDTFLAMHPSWPCAEVPKQSLTCINWDSYKENATVGPVFERGGITFILERAGTVVQGPIAQCGTAKALHLGGGRTTWLVFSQPVRTVTLCVVENAPASADAYSKGVLVQQLNLPIGATSLVVAAGLDAIKLTASDDLSVAQLCFETEAAAAARDSAQEYLERTTAGLTHWSSAEEILEPDTWYRVKVKTRTIRTCNGDQSSTTQPTHYAYFQTVGPPGLAPDWALDEASASTTSAALGAEPYPRGGSLTTLAPYVEAPIPSHGARPVFRAYDVGVDFNESYVEQMYGADMCIRLLDGNDRPVLDADGDEVTLQNQWAATPTVEISETELPYLSRVEDCKMLPDVALAPNQRLVAASATLLEDDFEGPLSGWTQAIPAIGPNTRWTANGGTLTCGNPLRVESVLVAGDRTWTDYAIEVQVGDQGADVGIVIRYLAPDAYCRIRLDDRGRYFERVTKKGVAALWRDAVPFVPGSATTLAVSCRGNRVRAQLDDQLVFDLDIAGLPKSGKMGVYAGASARFEHVVVREWPGAVLAPGTLFVAQLQASFVLFQGGLLLGWVDPSFAWIQLTRNANRIAAIGQDEWDDCRVEVSVTPNDKQVGVIVRFQMKADGTFVCYRLLLTPKDQTLRLVRLSGTISGTTWALDDADKGVLFESVAAQAVIDFALTEHDFALACEGDWLIVEVDGDEVARVQDPAPLLAGRVGLFAGDETPEFSALVVRSAPRRTVYEWSFSSSAHEGFVELFDTFGGQVVVEEVSGVNARQVANRVTAAVTRMNQATAVLASARQSLAGASALDLETRRLAAQEAAAARNAASAAEFDRLHDVLLDSAYRPAPPMVELSEIVEGGARYALLLESPEPLEWSRIGYRLATKNETSGLFEEVNALTIVWNVDGTRSFLVLAGAASWPPGEHRLDLVYSLNLGAEAVLLRRGGSVLPETARVQFSLH